jgi:hypothetical protein
MWWNDILDVKTELSKLTDRISRLTSAVIELSNNPKTETFDRKMEDLKEFVITFLSSEEEFSPLNCIHEKLDVLVDDTDRKEEVAIALQTLDKFENYMKNLEKLNMLVNEFKGCVTLARGAIEERKELDKQTEETKKLAQISQEIYRSMASFVNAGKNIEQVAHFKLNAIYNAVCEPGEKKACEKRKTPKKLLKKQS